jgi:hypothetical protein
VTTLAAPETGAGPLCRWGLFYRATPVLRLQPVDYVLDFRENLKWFVIGAGTLVFVHSFIHSFHVEKSKLGNPALGYGRSQHITAKHNTCNTSHKNTIHNIYIYLIYIYIYINLG